MHMKSRQIKVVETTSIRDQFDEKLNDSTTFRPPISGLENLPEVFLDASRQQRPICKAIAAQIGPCYSDDVSQ